VKTLKDCFGHSVRLTDERLAHILDHPEMEKMGSEGGRVFSSHNSFAGRALM
jgi:hypothetical protein